MALAARQGGAVGIRANTKEDILAIKQTVDLPVIGIVKRDYADSEIYITPTMKEVEELIAAGTEIIAVDATDRIRPNGVRLDDFLRAIKERYPSVKLMADCSTYEEAIHADELGFDIIATTLVGYTPHSKQLKINANDFELLSRIIKNVKHPVIAEGNIDTPEKAKRVLELGAFAVVVGGAITRPQLITAKFVNCIKEIK
jgi:N-acylglucosamine-6-phosphate 2-epimerase